MVKRLLLATGLVIGLVLAGSPAGAHGDDDADGQYPPAAKPVADDGVAIVVPGAKGAAAPEAAARAAAPAAPAAAPAAEPTGELPRTGDDSSLPLLRAGGALLAVGGLLVFLTRRRQPAQVRSTASV